MGEWFSNNLIEWYKKSHRDLPWRSTTSPYFIWLSEVILQQTQVVTGERYYLKFIEKFKTVQELACAEEKEVLNLWQGLGYYSRARNLHETAKHISNNLNGKFPNQYKDLIKLKGVGHYTAAAIASFSFGERVAVLDGNVFRVLSRVFEIDDPINSTLGIKKFKTLSQDLLPEKYSETYNQAIMEFGALQCTPKSPNCQACPINHKCLSFKNSTTDSLPRKINKTKVKPIYIHYFILQNENKFLIRERTEKGIWKNLWEFPNVVSGKPQSPGAVCPYGEITISYGPFKHLLSHRKITAHFHKTNTTGKFTEGKWVDMTELAEFPIHRLMEKFIEENSNFLED